MQAPFSLSRFFSRRALQEGNVLEVCRSERIQPRLAGLALVGLLLGQTLVPCGILLSSIHAAELRVTQQPSVTKSQSAPIPAWAKDLEKRAAQQQRGQKARLAQFQRPGQSDTNGDGAEAADLDCLDCEVDVQPLDLSGVPTEKTLRRAGGVEGALYPMRRADPRELGIKLDRLFKRVGVEGGLRGQLPPKDPRFIALKRAQQRYERARAINTLFGRGVKLWQQGERAGATELFAQYMREYPKTPWSGEALLHLGYEAKDGGRLAEALEIFQTIQDKTSEKPNKELRAKKRERKTRGVEVTDTERETDVDAALAGVTSLEAAVDKLDSSEESEEDDESFEIHMKAKQQLADIDLTMGHYNAAQEKLSEIVRDDTNWRRRTWASSEWQRASFLSQNATQLVACGPQALGLVMVSQNKVAEADKVRQAKAPRAQGFSLAELKTLAHNSGVEMRGFEATTSDLAQLPLPAILRYDFGPDAPASGKATLDTSNGHFVVLQGVDTTGEMVRLYDPLKQASLRMSYVQLQRQWSGEGLAVKNKSARLVGAPLSVRAMQGALGGQSVINRNVGDAQSNAVNFAGAGAPTVSINRFSLNQNIEHTVMAYEPSRGPSVAISLNFNSQDALNQYQKFGRKWTFNYTTYAYESGTRVYVLMPDGSRGEYIYNSANPSVFKGLAGNFSYIEKSAAAYTLVFQDGSRWIYNRTGAAVSFVSRMEDPWQAGIDLIYNGGNLTTIRDADGRDTTVSYNADGLVESVRDPFNRVATFTYFNNHLYGCTNMEGQSFEYRYGGPIVSSIAIPQAGTVPPIVWLYNQSGPNPAAGDPSITVTATNPLSDSMSYSYNASTYISTETDYKGNKTEYSFVVGPTEELLNRTVYPFDGSERGAVVTEFNELGLLKTAYHESMVDYPLGYWGKSEFTYNAQGQVRTTKDGGGYVTTFDYDAGTGLDIISTVNANNTRTINASYNADPNAKHQPTSVTDLSSNATTNFTYTPWGAPEIATDPLNRATRYVYGTAGNELRRLIQVQSSDAPATSNGPRNWVTVSSFTYDAAGRVLTSTDAANLTIGYDYDLADRVKAVKYSDNTREETTYLNGLPVIFKDRAGRYSYTEYDVLGRAKKSYTQDAQNNVPVGTVVMGYDKNSNLTLLTDSKNKNTAWTYDSRDRQTSKIYNNNEAETFSYSHGLLRNDKHGGIYDYDKNGNVTTALTG